MRTTAKTTTKKMIVVNALISTGIGPFLILACTKVDNVSIWLSPLNKPAPLVNLVTMKSSRERVMASKKPEKIPGKVSGKMTLVKA